VPANIAGGCGRRPDRDFNRFLTIALGSASELEYHLLLAYDLRMLSAAEHRRLDAAVVGCKKMLTSLIAKVATDAQAAL
jgi:four helix bundle protein